MPRFAVMAAVTLIIAMTLLVGRSKHRESIVFNPLVVAFACYTVLTGVSLLASNNTANAIVSLSKSCLYLVTLWILLNALVNDSWPFSSVARVISVAAFLLSGIAVLQYFDAGFRWLPGNVTPYATMANKNLLSSSLFLMLPFAIYTFLTGRGPWLLLSSISVVACSYTITISQTRSVWIALIVASIVAAIGFLFAASRLRDEFGKANLQRMRLPSVIAVTLFGVLLGVFSLYAVGSTGNEDGSRDVINFGTASMTERLNLWSNSLEMYADNPIIGTGAGDWKIDILKYDNANLASRTGDIFYQRPHNDFIWIVAESGLLALLFYCLVFGVAIYWSFRGLKTAKLSKNSALPLSMLFGLSGYMVIAFFSYPKERIVHTLLLLLMLAAVGSIRANATRTLKSCPLIVALFTIIVSSLCLMIAASRIASESHIRNALQAKELQDWSVVISEIDDAKSPVCSMDLTSTPLDWYRGVATFALGNTDDALDDFERAYQLNPYHVHVLNNLGTCYEVKGRHSEAIVKYEEALAIIPDFEETLLNLAAVLYNIGEYSEAYHRLKVIDGLASDNRYRTIMHRIEARLRGDSSGSILED